MMTTPKTIYWRYRGHKSLRDAATVVLTVAIALLGALMMTLTSSPLVKGAAFLWLPAALQLISGVWLGPVRGAIAAGVGAQAAGIIAYGGWAPADFIMNLIAGGLANAFLPAVLFQSFNLAPDLNSRSHPGKLKPGMFVLFVLPGGVIALAIAAHMLISHIQLGGIPPDSPLITALSYLIPLAALLAAPLFAATAKTPVRDFLIGITISIFCCFISASIGVVGAWVGGQTWEAAILLTGIGWFLGDSASCILGLYILAQFGALARDRGLAPLGRINNGSTMANNS